MLIFFPVLVPVTGCPRVHMGVHTPALCVPRLSPARKPALGMALLEQESCKEMWRPHLAGHPEPRVTQLHWFPKPDVDFLNIPTQKSSVKGLGLSHTVFEAPTEPAPHTLIGVLFTHSRTST